MRRILRHPATNAVSISLFTAFYGVILILSSASMKSGNMLFLSGSQPSANPFWEGWRAFLAAGYQAYIAYAVIGFTILTVILLVLRRHPYDEYHTALLLQCLAVATVLTLIAIALFFLAILADPTGFAEKFMLFIVIHWVTVVLADLTYVLLCRWR